ncbi:MAG: DUF2059 domain-containing protein [Desulfobacterales bacterium]|jgi:hypothetical protein
MIKILMAWTVTFCLLVTPAVADSINPAKKADIEKLIRITGPPDVTRQTSDFFIRQFSQTIRASRPDLPAKTYRILSEEINKVVDEHMTTRGGFLDMVVPIYAKHFTHKEIKALLKFYQTDLGRKTIKVWPLILQESMLLAQDWWKSLSPVIRKRVNNRFKNEGIELTI